MENRSLSPKISKLTDAETSALNHTNVSLSKRAIKRISLQVTSSMHKRFREIALEREETMNSLIVFALKRYLKEIDELEARNEKLRIRLKR